MKKKRRREESLRKLEKEQLWRTRGPTSRTIGLGMPVNRRKCEGTEKPGCAKTCWSLAKE